MALFILIYIHLYLRLFYLMYSIVTQKWVKMLGL